MKIADIRFYFNQSGFSDISRHFADFMAKLSESRDPSFYLACGLISNRSEQGDVCLNLENYAGGIDFKPDGEPLTTLNSPPLEKWIETLQNNPAVGEPGDQKPLILDTGARTPRLYLLRYWQYEQRLATYIQKSAERPIPDLNQDMIEASLARLFPNVGSDQAMVARAALENRFCVISGGPGTGKTTTVLKIILLLLEQARDGDLKLALAAPTGKAANRLQASILSSLAQAQEMAMVSDSILSGVPSETVTIHRLLGTISNSPRFRHNRTNPLPLDCVIVDEASMVDLALMSKLVDALKPDCRLIVLGDKNQLSSVESGSVLADICSVPENDSAAPFTKGIVSLKKSYRFNEQSGIGQTSNRINAGDPVHALYAMENDPDGAVSLQNVPKPADLRDALKSRLLPIYRSHIQAGTAEAAFQHLSQFCVLCALRNGLYGSMILNRIIEQFLLEEKLVPARETWYPGRPIMISRNDYQLGLYNGDIGIVLPDSEDQNRLKVHFDMGSDGYRKISPLRLPEHESAFAMTIHKSQGSEFDHALIILPDQDSRVLSRELLYTAITRARKSVEVWGDREILTRAINRKTERSSGLREALYR